MHLERLVGRLAVVHESFYLMHALVQRAAKGYVHFLEPTANAQHGNPGGDGRTDQRKRSAIPGGIVASAWLGCRPTIMMGFHIGW
ncbi:hypothetical protein FQZ97_1110170 [compost metagenome]